MMRKTLSLIALNGDGEQCRLEVESVALPFTDGSAGILPGHLPMLAALKTGDGHYVKNGVKYPLKVTSGIACVTKDHQVILLMDAAEGL